LKTPNFKKYYLVASIAYLLILIILVTGNYFSEKHKLIKHVNSELLASVKTVPALLPTNFHHRGMLNEGLTQDIDKLNIDRLSRQVKTMGIKYLYTMIQVDNKIIFTSSSATDQELATNKNVSHFSDIYDEASHILENVFKSKRMAYADGTDRWGAYHTVYLPMYSEDGTLYVIGADVDLTWVNERLNKELLNAFIYIFVFFILLIPFILIYRKQTKYIHSGLEDTIFERTKELQQQKYALDAHAIVAITDIQGTITFVNNKFEEISGYTRDELIGNNHRMLSSGTHDSDFWQKMYQTVSHGNVWHADVKNKAKDGTYYWVDTTIIPFLNAKGKPESYISIRTDITALITSRELILRKEELLQTLLDSVTEGIYGVDALGNCTFVNKSFLRILGYDNEDEVIGKHIHELTHHSHKDGTHYPSNECKIYKINSAHQSAHSDEEVFWKRDGTCIDVEYWSYPMLRDGNCIGAVATFMDITEQKALKKEHEAQEKLMFQQARLVQMGEMISMIAHQWRQPLSAIASTAVNMKLKIDFESFDLDTNEGRDAQRDFYTEKLGNIQSYVDNLSSIIDDFRNFYRPDKQTVLSTFRTIIDKALIIVQNSIESDRIELIKEYSNEQEFEMHDTEMLQVILNIIKNAQDNFKEKGISHPQIKIIVDNNILLICDNGGGIPHEVLEKIFDPYFSTKDEKNGTGIGLYMSKTIIENHHQGTLSAYNEKNGVCFKIQLRGIDA
jgi:PAS domain S-box-containing protein